MDSALGPRRRRSENVSRWVTTMVSVALLCLLAARDTTAQSSGLQIIGVQQEDCGLSPNLWQTRPVFRVCAAQEAPFLVRRYGYRPLDASCGSTDASRNSTENSIVYAEEYARIEQVHS